MHPNNKPVQELTDSQKLFILKQYNAGMKIKVIYKRMAADDDRVRDSCERFIGSERSFRYIIRKQVLKNVIKKVATKINLDSVEDKLKFISDVISDSDNKAEVKLRALELFSDLQKQAGLEKQAGMLTIANPDNIKITPELLREITMMSRTDMGGLHTLDFDILNKDELKLLLQSVDDALRNKPDLTPNKATSKNENQNDKN